MRAITYREMDEKIVDMLEHREDPMCRYAASRIQELEGRLALMEEAQEIYQSIAERMRRTEEALAHCGTVGPFDTFDSPADAICQMAGYIKGLQKRLEEAEAVIWR